MRSTSITGAALAAAAMLVMAGPAEATKKKRGHTHGYSQSSGKHAKSRVDADSFTSGRRGDSKDDIDARAADPGGDFAGYPSWARKALGGNKPLGL